MLALAAVVGVLCAAASTPLERARAQLAELDYAGATQQLDAALLAPDNSRETLIAIYELQGIVAGSLKQVDRTRAAFQHLLTLDPKHKLPGKLPPRVTTPFFEALGWLDKHPALELVRQSAQRDDAGIHALSVRVPSDALHLAASVRFGFASGPPLDVPLVNGVATAAVQGARVAWWATVIGAHGAHVAELGSEGAPLIDELPPAPPPPAAPPLPEPRAEVPAAVIAPAPVPVPAAPPPAQRVHLLPAAFVTLGLAAAAGGVGAWCGARSRQLFAAYDGATVGTDGVVSGVSRHDALVYNDTAVNSAIAADVLFAAAGALALVAAVLFIVELARGSGP